MNKHLNTRTVVSCALLIALQIVFVRLMSFGTASIRISLGFVPVAISGMLLGPVGGGIVGAMADFLGMLLFSRGMVYFFPLTISEFLYGFGFGLMLFRRELSPVKLSLCVLIQFVFVNLLLTSFWLYLYFIYVVGVPKGFGAIVWGRVLAACVNLPAQIIGINIINKYLKKPIGRFAR